MNEHESGRAETKGERTRQRIVASGARELARHGYGGTSLRNVAAGAELHLGSLYFHFSTKDDLIAEVMREGIEFASGRVTSALAALPADADADERLSTAIRAHLEALHSSRDRSAAVLLMADSLPAELRGAHTTKEREYGRLWLGILEDARTAGLIDPDADPRLVRDLVLGALNGTLRTSRSGSVDALTRAALALFVRRGVPDPGTGPHNAGR